MLLLVLTTVLSALSTPVFAALPRDDVPPATIESLRPAIHELIRKGDWKEAKAKIKEFKKVGKSHVSQEAKELSKWVKARKSFVELKAKHADGKGHPRQILARTDALAKKYPIDAMKEEVREFRQVLLNELFLLLDNFERPRPADSDVKLVKNPCHWGRQAMHWFDDSIYETQWAPYCNHRDWSDIEALVFWCYAKKPGQIFEVRVWTGDRAHMASVKVRWTGWQEVRLPLVGKKSPFRGDPGAGWRSISSVNFFKEEGLKIDVVIDDLMLEKKFTPKKK